MAFAAIERNLKSLFHFFGFGEYPAEYNPRIHGPYDPSRNYGKGKFMCTLFVVSGRSHRRTSRWVMQFTESDRILPNLTVTCSEYFDPQ